MELHPDRLFPADEKMRAIARQLYASVKDLPLICPHGHTDPRWFALNEQFSDATSLFVTSDPYILRLLYGHGVPLESVGVSRQDNFEATSVASPRTAWRNFAKHYYLFQGTPSRLWLDAVFQEIFEIEYELSVTTADFYFDHIGGKLRQENFRPRALFQRFRIEFLATTDGACDALNHHAEIRSSAWEGRVVPTFRPDVALNPDDPAFLAEIVQLARLSGENTECAAGYLNALRSRRLVFRDAGATATDHGHATALTANLDPATFASLYEAAISNRLPSDGAALFRAHMLTEMARMSIDDGLVMQLHVGAWRGYNKGLVERYGFARGESVPQATNFVEGGVAP
ncbi:glucuronate isomerase [Pararhizobium sp. DWP3-4]|uniref:glucuronate isomerase n=1 Tax=Pararhizobium sp. DWP3-4 TaxID=2804565 RepID=UPI003CEA6630